jgi:hypothetical protein
MVGMSMLQASELSQLHRTNAKMANLLETQNVMQEVLWRGMKMWSMEKDDKRDGHHEDD